LSGNKMNGRRITPTGLAVYSWREGENIIVQRSREVEIAGVGLGEDHANGIITGNRSGSKTADIVSEGRIYSDFFFIGRAGNEEDGEGKPQQRGGIQVVHVGRIIVQRYF